MKPNMSVKKGKVWSHNNTKGCFINTNHVLLLAISIKVICLNVNWFLIYASDKMRVFAKSEQQGRFDVWNFQSETHQTRTSSFHNERQVHSDIINGRNVNLTDLEILNDAKEECPIVTRRGRKTDQQPPVAKISTKLRNSSHFPRTSYIPSDAIQRSCKFLRTLSSTDIESFRNHVVNFEKTFGKSVSAVPEYLRYLLSLNIFSTMGYEQVTDRIDNRL